MHVDEEITKLWCNILEFQLGKSVDGYGLKMMIIIMEVRTFLIIQNIITTALPSNPTYIILDNHEESTTNTH